MAYNYYGREIQYTLKESIYMSIKKIKKFYPLHLFTFVAAAILIVVKLHPTIRSTIELSICNLLLIQSWFTNQNIYWSFNGVSWYLSTIMFCYFMTPLILYVIKKLDTSQSLIKITMFILLFKIIFESVFSHYKYSAFLFGIFPPYRCLEYIVGCLMGTIFLHEQTQKNEQSYIFTSIMQFIACIFYISAVVIGRSCGWTKAYYILFVVLLIYTIAMDGFISRLFSNKFFIHFGGISFEFFMIHQIVIRYAINICTYFNINLETMVKCYGIFVIAIILSEIAHYISNVRKNKTKSSNEKINQPCNSTNAVI